MALAVVRGMRRNTPIIALAVLLLSQALLFAQPPQASERERLEALLNALDPSAVQRHATTISGFGSRLTGYEGYNRTLEYIVATLRSYGLEPVLQPFQVLVPWDAGSTIRVPELGIEIRAHCVWPNGHVGTWSVRGLRGKLVYVGRGELEDFEGKEIEGSIVVMDFASLGNWRNAVKLGAKAVIFVDTGGGDRYEAYTKFEWYAFYPFVRLYVSGGEARRLIELARRGFEAEIDSKLELRAVTAYNVLVRVPGRREGEAIMAVASVDAWSVVPAMASSVQDAVNVGLLLELARIVRQAQLERSLWIAFLSGHWQGLAGARALAENFTRDPDLTSGRTVVWYVVGIDLSDDFPGVSLIYMGHFYRAGRALFTAKYSWIQEVVGTQLSSFLKGYLQRRNLIPANLLGAIDTLGLVREVDLVEGPDWSWSGTMATPYILDTEPFVVAGMAGFTIRTQFSYRNWEGVPGATSMRWEYVLPQLYQASAVVLYAAIAEAVRLTPASVRPTRFTGLGGGGAAGVMFWGLITFRVSVASFNITAGWYTPVQHAVVRVWSYPHDYPFASALALTGADGVAEIVGLAPQGVCYWRIDAVRIDPDGVYTVDFGVYGVQPAALVVGALQDPMPVFVPVFKGGVLVLADLVSPRLFRAGAADDPRMGGIRTWYSLGREVRVYEVGTRAEPMFWGVYGLPQDEVVLVSAPIGSRIVVAAKPENPPLEPRPVVLLANSSEAEPEGVGVLVEPGFTVISRPALAYAIDLYRTARYRYEQLRGRMVRRLSAEVYEARAGEYIQRALEAYREHRYAEAYRYSLLALSYAARFYSDEVMPLYDEIGRTAVLMLFLFLPSAFFLERLLVHGEGMRRILSTLAIGAAAVLLFSLAHPALSVLANSAMAVMAVAILLVTLLLFYVFFSETSSALLSYAESRIGAHEFRREEAAAALLAISTSLENMRRRPLRTTLTLLTIIAVATAVVALTSTSPTVYVSTSARAAQAPYEGVLVRRGFGVLLDVLSPFTVEAVKGLAPTGSVAPRLWYYPVSVNKVGPYGLVVSERGSLAVQAVLGLEPIEAEALLRGALESGSTLGRGQVYACLLTSSQARLLNVSVGDAVEFMGFKLVVVGVLSDEALLGLPRDPDGYYYVPIDPAYSNVLYGFTFGGGQISPTPLSWDRVLIVSGSFAAKLGAFINSVSVVMPGASSSDLLNLAGNLSHVLDAGVYAYVNGTSYSTSRLFGYAFLGWESVGPLLVLGGINVVATLLAAVYERTRELYVYSSLGLSPRGAALMYLVEFLVYGFIGAFVGYMAGWMASRWFMAAGLLPETFVFNYASASVALAMAAIVAVCAAASAYPAIKAAQLITPSLERVWKPPTKPRGDVWELTFPLRLISREEALGLLNYLKEYYLGAGYYKPSHRVVSVGEIDASNLELKLRVLLTPTESGTEQEVSIKVIEQPGRRFIVAVAARFLGGSRAVWTSSNIYYLDDLRKQLLLWVSLPGKEKSKYVREAQSL
ncbi:MAG: FtsX-like permease family protein [Thermofilaceae archaeon]